MNDDAGFVAVRRLPGADDLRPTPVEQREGLIEEFRRKNRNCAIKQIWYWANVSRGDFNKWKNGRPEVPDTSVKAIRIEKLLQLDIKTRE